MLTDSHEILKKTKFIVFKPSQKRSSVNIQLLINGHKLDQVKETVFLGVMLYKNLNWKFQNLSELSVNLVSTCRQSLYERYIFH